MLVSCIIIIIIMLQLLAPYAYACTCCKNQSTCPHRSFIKTVLDTLNSSIVHFWTDSHVELRTVAVVCDFRAVCGNISIITCPTS